MNAGEVLLRLYQERKTWRCDGQVSGEVKWVIKGLTIAIEQVKALKREQHAKQLSRKPRISRWYARDLFHTIDVALKYLGRADRAKAIAVLEEAKERALKDVTS